MTDKSKTIFLTGVTGTLGQDFIELLLKETSHRLILLARGKKAQSAEERIRDILDKKGLAGEVGKRIDVVDGDITSAKLGLTDAQIEKLKGSVQLFFHIAALTTLNGSEQDCFDINFEGTKNVLELIWILRNEGKLERFYYFSTAFVAGSKQTYESKEDELAVEPAHANFYEASKYAAEGKVREAMAKGLPVTIFRPSIVVGDSQTGKVNDFNVIYPFLRLFAHGALTTLAADLDNSFNIVPIDFVVKAAKEIAFHEDSVGKTYHLVTPNQPTIRQLMDVTYKEYPNTPKINVVSTDEFKVEDLGEEEKMVYDILDPYLGYLNDHLTFDYTNTKAALEGTDLSLPNTDEEFLKRLLKYAVDTGYLVLN